MTIKDFLNKYKITLRNVDKVLEVLDILYLEYTKDQALAMVKDYYENADDIFNSLKDLDER